MMNIDLNKFSQLLTGNNQFINGTDEPSEVFNKKVQPVMVESGTIFIDDLLKRNGLQKKRMLGLGAYGKIHPVQNKHGENQFVLKIKRQTVMDKPFDNELSPLMVQDKGTPVVEAYFGVIRHKVDRHLEVVYSIEDFNLKSQEFELEAVALELVEGKDFDKYLRDYDPYFSPIPEEKMLMLAQEVSKGASQINENHLVHRDLKPKNIMCSEKDGKVKLTFIDFSTATTVDDAQKTRHDGMDGSDGFTPPEAYESKGNRGIKEDSWALGAILTVIAFGKTPNEIYDESTGGKLDTDYENTRGFAEWDDETKREVLLNEFKDGVSDKKIKYVNAIIALTKLDPEQRVTTADAYQEISAITIIEEGFDKLIPVAKSSEQVVLAPGFNRATSRESGIDPSEQAVEDLSFDNLPSGNIDGIGPEAGKARTPLEMTFLERQVYAALKRKEREALYKTRAEAEQEWVKGFRGNKKK